MNELFFGGGAGLFTAAAAIGTLFFGARLSMMLIGFDGGDGDFDVDADVDADAGDAFRVLSFQAISAFLMGFGWFGLAGLKGSGWPWLGSLMFGGGAGLGMMWFSGKLMALVYRMQASGTLGIEQALLTEGTVYAAIPAPGEGKGQVRVVIGDRARFYNAVSEEGAIESRTPIRVTSVNTDNTVTVSRI